MSLLSHQSSARRFSTEALGGGGSASSLLQSLFGVSYGGYDVQRLKEELVISNAKLAKWEDGMAQARSVRI